MAPQYHIRFFSYQLLNPFSKLKLFSLPLKGNLPLGRLPPPNGKEEFPKLCCVKLALSVAFNLLNGSLGFFPSP